MMMIMITIVMMTAPPLSSGVRSMTATVTSALYRRRRRYKRVRSALRVDRYQKRHLFNPQLRRRARSAILLSREMSRIGTWSVVAAALLCCLSPRPRVLGLPLDAEWTDLESVSGSRDRPAFPGPAHEPETQSMAVEIGAQLADVHHLDDESDEDQEPLATVAHGFETLERVNGSHDPAGLDTRFGFFNKPYPPPFYGAGSGLVPPHPFNHPAAPVVAPYPHYHGAPFGGANFASGLNSTGFFWNGAYFPFETTTTTTSAPSSGGGNYYAFFFRQGENQGSTLPPTDESRDPDAVRDAIDKAQSAASEPEGFSFGA